MQGKSDDLFVSCVKSGWRILEHVIANLIVAIVIVVVTIGLIAYYTGSFPSPRILLTSLTSKPYVVWRARALPTTEYRKSHIFMLEADLVRARYQISVHNHGEAASTATRVVVEVPDRVVAVRAVGDVRVRGPDGAWQTLSPQDKAFAGRGQRLEFHVVTLLPTETAQIDIVIERSAGRAWEFPPTRVHYEQGPASMGVGKPEGEWK
jgi:hypothetical protein